MSGIDIGFLIYAVTSLLLLGEMRFKFNLMWKDYCIRHEINGHSGKSIKRVKGASI